MLKWYCWYCFEGPNLRSQWNIISIGIISLTHVHRGKYYNSRTTSHLIVIQYTKNTNYRHIKQQSLELAQLSDTVATQNEYYLLYKSSIYCRVIALVFLLLCPPPVVSNALQKNLAFCTDKNYLLDSIKALTSCVVLSADAGLYGYTVWHGTLLCVCIIVLSGNVFNVFIVILYFIMRLYCVFYCRTSLETNFH